MIAFIFANQNLPFAVALVLMVFIALLEGAATLLGMGISGFLDSLIPDMDADVDIDMDVDVDADVHAPHLEGSDAITRALSWLRIGQVPVLVLLVIFLTAFGLLGLAAQSLSQRLLGGLMPALAASGIAFVAALPMVRLFGGILARLIPKDETEAVTEQSFIGLVAVITMGCARQGCAAQGKLKDRHGQTHYIMIEPDSEDDSFEQGAEVLLVSQQGAFFRGIRNTSALLTPKA